MFWTSHTKVLSGAWSVWRLVGPEMVIFKSQAHAKPTIPPLNTSVWDVQNTQDELLTLTWARERLFLVIWGWSRVSRRADGKDWSAILPPLDDLASSVDVS